MEDINSPYGDVSIYVTGVSEELQLRVQDNNGLRRYISKDGVYTFTNNALFFGFTTNKIGDCNITIQLLPLSKVRDLSNNGNDLYLYKFKGQGNSGIGMYHQYLKNSIIGSSCNENSQKFFNKIHLVKNESDKNNWFGYVLHISRSEYNNKSSYRMKVSYTPEGAEEELYLKLGMSDLDTVNENVYDYRIPNGDTIMIDPIPDEKFNTETPNVDYVTFSVISDKDIEIDLEILPDYPNMISHTGKEYGVAYNLPIMTDYTLITKRKWNEIGPTGSIFCSKSVSANNGSFIFEYFSDTRKTYSYYESTSITEPSGTDISYQSKTSYNGQEIQVGTATDSNKLFVGGIRTDSKDGDEYIDRGFIGGWEYILLYDHSMTKEEIDKIISYLDKI